MSALAMKVKDKGLASFCALLVLIGCIMMLGGGAMLRWWWFLETPAHAPVNLYITTKGSVEPGLSFKPGYPNVAISFDEFRARSRNLPYLVSFPSRWSGGGRVWSYEAVSYTMKHPELDLYLVAVENPPVYDAPGYIEHTAFDPASRAFVHVLEGRRYGPAVAGSCSIFVGVVLFLLGCVLMDDALRGGYHGLFRS